MGEGVDGQSGGTLGAAADEEQGLRAADQAGDAGASRRLGELLQRQGDIDGAEAAFKRAESRGEVGATVLLGFLYEDHRQDLEAAEAAFRRADAAGDVNGSGNLGELLRKKGNLREAEEAFKRCVERGGSARALCHYAGLLSQRSDAGAAEITEAVVWLCRGEDRGAAAAEEDRDVEDMMASLVLSGVEERCDPDAVEAGFRLADEAGSAAGAYNFGRALGRRGNQTVASVEAFRRAGERGSANAWGKAAFGLHSLGDLDAALECARRGDEAGDGGASALLGMLLDERGDTDGGLEAYRRADERGDKDGSFNLGIELMNRGDLYGAIDALERAEGLGEEKAIASLVVARSKLEGGELPDFTQRLAGESLWAWGLRLENAGDWAGAVAAYAQATDAGEAPRERRAILRYAEQLESRGRHAEAEAAFHRVTGAGEPDVKAAAWRGIAHYHGQRGEADQALAALRVVVNTEDSTEAPRALRNIGVLLEDAGDLDGARSAYEAAISHHHPVFSPGATVNLAQLLDRIGDHAGAATLFREAADSSHPEEAPRARVLFGTMCEEHGQINEALQWWESVSGSGEWAKRAALNAGMFYAQRDDFAAAAPLFRKASAFEDSQEAATAFYFLGLAERALGNGIGAAEAMRRAMALGDSKVQAEARRAVANLERRGF